MLITYWLLGCFWISDLRFSKCLFICSKQSVAIITINLVHNPSSIKNTQNIFSFSYYTVKFFRNSVENIETTVTQPTNIFSLWCKGSYWNSVYQHYWTDHCRRHTVSKHFKTTRNLFVDKVSWKTIVQKYIFNNLNVGFMETFAK